MDLFDKCIQWTYLINVYQRRQKFYQLERFFEMRMEYSLLIIWKKKKKKNKHKKVLFIIIGLTEWCDQGKMSSYNKKSVFSSAFHNTLAHISAVSMAKL